MTRDVRNDGVSRHLRASEGLAAEETRRRNERSAAVERGARRSLRRLDGSGAREPEATPPASGSRKKRRQLPAPSPAPSSGVTLRNVGGRGRNGAHREDGRGSSSGDVKRQPAPSMPSAAVRAPKERVAEAVRARLAELVQPEMPAGLLATKTVGEHIADALLRGPELASSMHELASVEDLGDLIAGVVAEHREAALEVARWRRQDVAITGESTRALDARIRALEELSPLGAAATAAAAVADNLRQELQLRIASSLERLGATMTDRLERLTHPPVAEAMAAALLASPELAAGELAAMGLVDVELERLLAPGEGERLPEVAGAIVSESRARLRAFREAKVAIESIAGDLTLLGAEARELVLDPELVALGLDPERFPYHRPANILEQVVRDGRRSTGLAELVGRFADPVAAPYTPAAKLLAIAARAVRITDLDTDLARVGVGSLTGARLAGFEEGARGVMRVAVDAIVGHALNRALGAVVGRLAPDAVRMRDAHVVLERLASFAAGWVVSAARAELPEAKTIDRAARGLADGLAGALLPPDREGLARDRALVRARIIAGLSLVGPEERRRLGRVLAEVAPGVDVGRTLPGLEAVLAAGYGAQTAELIRSEALEGVVRDLILDSGAILR